MLPSEIPRLATELLVRLFPGVWNLLSFLRLPSQEGYPSLPLLSLFFPLYFVLPPFEDNGLPFWVPDVLCQHSEVVLWNLLSKLLRNTQSSNVLLMNLWGEKVVSPSYSSGILGPPLNYFSFEWDIMWYLRTQTPGPDSVQVSLAIWPFASLLTLLLFNFLISKMNIVVTSIT